MARIPSNSRYFPGLAAVGLVAAVLLAYGNSLHAPFVYDDALAITENPTIRRLWPLHEVLLPQSARGLTVSGRPVLNLSLALSYAASGTAPWGFHVFNILVHAGSALLLFGIVRRTVTRLRPTPPPEQAALIGLVAAAGWALHPLLTQAVTYTVQRAESLMGFFYFLTLYAFIRGIGAPATGDLPPAAPASRRKPAWLAVSVAACVLGMGTKEVMASAPVLVLLYDRTFGAKTFRGAIGLRRGFYSALAGTWVVLAALILSTGGNRGGTVGLGVGVPWWAYGLTQFQAIVRYLALSAWPHPLVFEYGTFWVRQTREVLPYAAVVLPLLAATAWALRRRPALGFCGAWFFLILAPTSLTPGTIQMIVEHRMYLPLAAITSVAAVWVSRYAGRALPWAGGMAGLALLTLTASRNHDYRSHRALWEDTVAKRPLNPRAHEGLAEACAESGDVAAAIAHRREAVRLLPDESTYHYNLALTLAEAGQLDEAIVHYRIALTLVPDEPRTHNNLAIALLRTGQTEAALRHYAEACRRQPDNPLFHYNTGVALLGAGRAADAAGAFQRVLQLDSGHADARFNLGTALVRLQRLPEALAQYEAAVRARPADAEFRTAFAGALLLAGRPHEALAQYQQVLAAHPGATEARFGAGNAWAALRRYDEAIAEFERLLRDAPRHADGHFKLGNALLGAGRVDEARARYEQALRLAPNDAEAHHNLGIACARLARWAEAEREFETALRLRPDYPEARQHLEQVRRGLGR